MTQNMFWFSVALNALTLALLIFLVVRSGGKTELTAKLARLEGALERMERAQTVESAQGRQESQTAAKDLRVEVSRSLKEVADSLVRQIASHGQVQASHHEALLKRLQALTQANEERLEKVRLTVETKLREIQDDNGKKLEEMRKTVDEKLHATLEKRLGESFKLVGERLELVHKGLGDMQQLASGVVDAEEQVSYVDPDEAAAVKQAGVTLAALVATRDAVERARDAL